MTSARTAPARPDDYDTLRDGTVEALATLVRHPTVSHRDPARVDTEVFDAFVADLARLFPLLHEHLELTRVHTHGLLFHWRGTGSERPVVLMAHFDVVPVEGGWTHPPFAGVVADGYLWGRGTLDDKGALVAVCAAVERLLADGFTPAQDVWLSFGCDEEVSGVSAGAAVELLRERGVRPWFVLDEGGAVAGQAFPGVDSPVAVIGVSEKGIVSLELTASGAGGHASTPTKWGPVTRIARALVRLEKSPFPASLPEPTLEMLERLAARMNGPLKHVLGRARRFPHLVTRAMVLAGPEPAALTRTTMAATTLSGSPALNVIAGGATAGVNLRIAVGESVASTVEHVRRAVNDPQVRITVVESSEPSPVSPYDDEAFHLLERTVARRFPDAVVTPYVMMAATDSRRFTEISDRVYRHAPFRMSKAQRETIHAVDERIGLDDLADGVLWYQAVIEGLA